MMTDQGPRAAETRRALVAAADALLEVADGPYAPNRVVASRAIHFRQTVARLGEGPELRVRRADALAALRSADATLRTVRGAAARGQVAEF